MTAKVESSTFVELAGSKLRYKLGAQLNESSAGAMPAFAKKQLEKLGWKEGEGLGKRRQGMSSHIKVVKRAEGLGLGESTLDPAIEQSLNANDWWKNSVGNTLAKLGKQKKKKDSKKKKKKKDKEATKIYTDEELFKATGGARFGMRAQTQQHSKWKRAESNISEKEEQEAKEKLEWNGMTAPRIILDEKKKDKKKKRELKSSEIDEAKLEKKRLKKEKKRRRKEQEASDSSSSKKQKK